MLKRAVGLAAAATRESWADSVIGNSAFLEAVQWQLHRE